MQSGPIIPKKNYFEILNIDLNRYDPLDIFRISNAYHNDILQVILRLQEKLIDKESALKAIQSFTDAFEALKDVNYRYQHYHEVTSQNNNFKDVLELAGTYSEQQEDKYSSRIIFHKLSSSNECLPGEIIVFIPFLTKHAFSRFDYSLLPINERTLVPEIALTKGTGFELYDYLVEDLSKCTTIFNTVSLSKQVITPFLTNRHCPVGAEKTFSSENFYDRHDFYKGGLYPMACAVKVNIDQLEVGLKVDYDWRAHDTPAPALLNCRNHLLDLFIKRNTEIAAVNVVGIVEKIPRGSKKAIASRYQIVDGALLQENVYHTKKGTETRVIPNSKPGDPFYIPPQKDSKVTPKKETVIKTAPNSKLGEQFYIPPFKGSKDTSKEGSLANQHFKDSKVTPKKGDLANLHLLGTRSQPSQSGDKQESNKSNDQANKLLTFNNSNNS